MASESIKISFKHLFYIMLRECWSWSKVKIRSVEIKKMLRISILLASHSRSQVHIILLRHWVRHSWLHSRIHIHPRLHTRLHALVHAWLHSLPVLLSRIHIYSGVHIHSRILCHSIYRHLLVGILRILSVEALLLVIIVRIVCHIIKLIILLNFIIINLSWSFSMTFRKK